MTMLGILIFGTEENRAYLYFISNIKNQVIDLNTVETAERFSLLIFQNLYWMYCFLSPLI